MVVELVIVELGNAAKESNADMDELVDEFPDIPENNAPIVLATSVFIACSSC